VSFDERSEASALTFAQRCSENMAISSVNPLELPCTYFPGVHRCKRECVLEGRGQGIKILPAAS
jgi:hypothetical protein